MPNAPTNDTSPTGTLNDREYDALAELFLGSENSTSPPLRLHRHDSAPPSQITPAPVASKPAVVEALILGHLPILAGPWVAQYAKHAAQTNHESIGLIRIYAGQCSLDIFSARAPSSNLTPSSHMSQAIQSAAPHVDRWVIRVDATDEPTLASTPGVTSLTLLSSTDDAAVVSAYQTIKRLEPVPLPDAQPRDIRVVFIGATDSESRHASAKLTRAVGAFLETPVQSHTGPDKLSPCPAHNLYRGDAPQNLAALLKQLADPPPPTPSAIPHQARAARPAVPVPAAPLPTPTAATTPSRTPPPQAASPAASPNNRLATHLPELRDLGVTCPYATNVSIAFDRAGHLHLLARHTDTTFQSLQIVRAWSLDHAALLAVLAEALGLHDAPIDLNAPITMHVFTDSINRVRRLLDAPVQFHLLTDITVNNTVTQACIPFNL